MIEFPAGKLDAGEDPLLCGQRELLEETGYTAREWARAGAMHLAIAYSTEVIHIYFARGLRPASTSWTRASSWMCSPPHPRAAGLEPRRRADRCQDLTCLVWLQNVLSGAWTLDWQATAGRRPDNQAMKVLNLNAPPA
jgi:ADP-ribose pyrophosphatase